MANDNNIQPVADDSQIVLYQPDESYLSSSKNRRRYGMAYPSSNDGIF